MTMPAPHHTFFTGRMLFLKPNQQRQTTDLAVMNTIIADSREMHLGLSHLVLKHEKETS